jgi:uncharacterized membrane protein (UPF0127 family)
MPSIELTQTTTAAGGELVRSEEADVVCERCVVADSPFSRARGLLGRRGLAEGEGLLLRPASSIHTWFMRFPIDAVFLAEDGTVLRVAAELRPWRAAGRRGARAVLELPAGECARRGLQTGDRLVLPPASS